jgi:N-acetylneuraminate synthase
MIGDKVTIIAEAGVNHNGHLDMAMQLVDAAADSGADFIKFQTFRSEKSVSADVPLAEYQMSNDVAADSMLEMVKKLELSFDDFRRLKDACATKGIGFLSTGFDFESVSFLHDLDVPFFKVASGELTNAPLLLHIAKLGRPIAVSTGAANIADIEMALGCLAFGFSAGLETEASTSSFADAFRSNEGQSHLLDKITLLHCTTEYPAPFDELNLRAIATLRDTFGLRVGYSDHSLGITAPIAATAMGAVMIEKHFTLDRNLDGPDHKASLEPHDLAAMVREIRAVETALGNGEKVPGRAELKNRILVRKSLVAAIPIKSGDVFSESNLIAKRPGSGLSPFALWSLIGRTAQRSYESDEQIDLDAAPSSEL